MTEEKLCTYCGTFCGEAWYGDANGSAWHFFCMENQINEFRDVIANRAKEVAALLELARDWKKDLLSGIETDGHRMPGVVREMFRKRLERIDEAIAQAVGDPPKS